MFHHIEEGVEEWKKTQKTVRSISLFASDNPDVDRIQRELYLLKGQTDKDILVAEHLGDSRCTASLDPASRIAPALLFSPHFGEIQYRLRVDTKQNLTVLYSPQYEQIRNSHIFRHFKYIKSVAPFRRPTTSSAATIRYTWKGAQKSWEKPRGEKRSIVGDDVVARLLNRSYLIDWQDRLFQDSVLARFEDGKLNPKATFTALAAFLDLPYTESMTYCSLFGERDPESYKGDARGFDLRAVHETYPDFLGENERYFLEYFLRDVYKACGYDFQNYDGKSMDEGRVEELSSRFDTMDHYIKESWKRIEATCEMPEGIYCEQLSGDELHELISEKILEIQYENRLKTGKTLLRGLRFINNHAQELKMMPLLKLDPALLEQPLYR